MCLVQKTTSLISDDDDLTKANVTLMCLDRFILNAVEKLTRLPTNGNPMDS